ncbi:DNA-binding response regulator [Lacrimispora sp.]|uniref:DNA-binding response regulator n=1 Tax=Lacrimispora sp. TaxID=2719234 RepID=UPI002FD8BFFB
MYRVLIATDDVLMRKAFNIMISREEKFQVAYMVGTGEAAVKACKKSTVHLIFMDMQMTGINGIEASWLINQSSPETVIYLFTGPASNVLIKGMTKGTVKDVLEKPVSAKLIKKILDNYKTEHEDSVQNQLYELAEFVRNRNFNLFYSRLPYIIDEVYDMTGNDSARLIKIFNYIGQNLLDMRNIYDSKQSVMQEFPINEALISERKISELWLFRVVDYLFRQNSISRYPLLENIFIYIEKHIKEDITLNGIIENCAISQGYLSRIIREQFQLSVMEYIHMKKMHLAKGYFYFTDDSIAEVAFKLGYNESSYFSKVFKKHESMTVKQYRNEIRRN